VKILVFAYACEPGYGSEPGAGWAGARMIAHMGDTWVITRANNREAIERGLSTVPEADRLHFVYIDLPASVMWWKRGRHGIRTYYVLWQLLALRTALDLHRRERFTLAWHLTFANAWFGATAPLLPFPCVYGPVGAGIGTSWPLLPSLGVRGATRDVAHAAARAAARYGNPLARLAWNRAALVLTQNVETVEWLPARHRHKAAVFPHVVLADNEPLPPRTPNPAPVALYVGRLMPHKGVALAIRALAELPGWRLLVCGSGSDRRRLERIAARCGVRDAVEFLGAVPRPHVLELMAETADVFIFPSLHDEAGWVVAEARSRGVPVVCLARGGPVLLGGHGVPAGRPGPTVRALASAMRQAVAAPRPPATDEFDFEHRSQALRRILVEAGIGPGGDGAEPLWVGGHGGGSSDRRSGRDADWRKLAARRTRHVATRAAVAAHAWLSLGVVATQLRRRSLPAVVAGMARTTPVPLPGVAPARLGQMVYGSLHVGRFQPRCLVTSLVHLRLLRQQGRDAELVIGLDPVQHGKDAHAWVEIGGLDVGPPPGRGGHEELVRYR
jgi:glycosyltransferase involved in cell wall biosynthesis